MALPNTLLIAVLCSLLLSNGGAYVHTKALNEFINYYEPVFFDESPAWDFNQDVPGIAKDLHARSTYEEQVDIRAFGRIFRLELNRSVSILSADADVTVMGGKETCTTEKVDPKTILVNLVEGRVVDEPKSFVHGVLIKNVFNGVIHLNNQTLFVERASKYFRDRMPFDCVIFRQEDLNMTAVDCEVGPEGYKCDPIRLLHRRGPGVEQVLSLAHSERSWFKGKTVAKTTCTLKVIADHLFTKHAGDGSATNAIYEMIFHVQEADHIYRKTDFDQDGVEDNVGFKIQEVLVQSSASCLENRAFMKPKLTSDQYLEIFSEYDFENYCVGIAFSGYTFPGRILGIAWMADADESGYVGGICEPRLFSTQDQKALSFNSAVITMMLQGRRMPRGITAIAVAHELGHSFGSDHDPHPDITCSPSDPDGGRFIMAAVAVKGDQPNNRFFSPCSIGHMKTVLRKKGNCFISLARSVCCDSTDNTKKEKKDSCCMDWLKSDTEQQEKEPKKHTEKELKKHTEKSSKEVYDFLVGGVAKESKEESKDVGSKGKGAKVNGVQEAEAKGDGGKGGGGKGDGGKGDGGKGDKKKPPIRLDKNKPEKKTGKKPMKPGKAKPNDKKKPPGLTLNPENQTRESKDSSKSPDRTKKSSSSSVTANVQGRRVPQTECMGPDKPIYDEEHFRCSPAQCTLFGQVSCECPDLQSSCVVCCKANEESEDCMPIRRKDTPWWLLRRPGEPCHGDTGKCDSHGHCDVDKADPLDMEKISRVVEAQIEDSFDGTTFTEGQWKLDPLEHVTRFMWSMRYGIEWFCDMVFRMMWMCVSVLFVLFIVLFICFVCPAVAVGIWCLQQCTCWSASNTLHDDDMYLLVDETEESYFKLAPQSVVVNSSTPCQFPEVKTRSRTH